MTDMQIRKIQQASASGIVLAVAIVVAWLSFTREPASAFLFPRYISVALLILSIWSFLRAIMGMALIGNCMDKASAIQLAPGLIIMGVYIFWLAKYLGFYAASSLTFFVLFAIYDPNSHGQIGSWLKRALITVVFMAIMYGLFNLVLKVQLPRGLYI